MLQPGPWMVGASLKGSSSLCYAQVPSQQFAAKVGAQQNPFPPVEEIGVGHQGFRTVMGPGLSGSRTAARKGLGRRWAQESLPAPTLDVTPGSCQDATSVHAYLGSLSRWG